MNNQETKMESLHFIVEGAFIVNIARQQYWFEDNEENGIKLIKEGFMGITDEQVMKLISADAQITGYSVCDKKDCHQCVGLKDIQYIEEIDADFKKEIVKRTRWLAKHYFKSGQFHIEKEKVLEYIVEKKVVEFAEKYGDISKGNERKYLQLIYEGFFQANSLKPIKYDDLPDPSTRSFKFAVALQNLIKNFVPNDEEKEMIDQDYKKRIKQVQLTYADYPNQNHFEIVTSDYTQTKTKVKTKEKKEKDWECEIKYDGKIIKLGKFLIEQRFLDDYANEVRFSRQSMILATYGVMDKENLQHPLEKRIAKHRRIYESIGIPYHSDFHDLRDMGKEIPEGVSDDVWDLTHLIDDYIVAKYPEISLTAMGEHIDKLEKTKKFISDYNAKNKVEKKK